MKISSVLGVLILVASAVGCSKHDGEAESATTTSKDQAPAVKQEAPDARQSTIEKFYEHRAKGDYAAAFEMMGKAYRQYYDKQTWIAAMKEFDTAAGGFKRAATDSPNPTGTIAVEYGNLATNERLTLSDSAPYYIFNLNVAEQKAAGRSGNERKADSRGVRITDPATEMTFEQLVEGISNNRPQGLLNRMKLEQRIGSSTPWHLLAGPREMTLLHFAAIQGATDSAVELIGLGTPVDVLAQHGSTPLFLAACAGHIEVVKLLVSHGADVGRINDLGLKPQDCAKAQGKLEVASWLESQSSGDAGSPFAPLRRIEGIAKAKYNELCSSISAAIRSTPNNPQTIAQVKSLIDKDYFSSRDSCFVIEEGPPDTALHQMNAAIRSERGRGKVVGNILVAAAAVGSAEVVRYAIEHGFTLKEGIYMYNDLRGERAVGPAILLAAQNGHAEVVRLLIEKGANVNEVDSGTMQRVLDYAEDSAIRRLLIDAGSSGG